MERINPIIKPSKWELFRLRLMILAGILVLFLFLRELFLVGAEYPPLYFMLIATIVYSCARLVHEWVHYFYITVPPTPISAKVYTVDIFTTFCKGEPYAMIEETLQAIVNITYPHQSYLCDESDDPYLKKLCADLGVFHVTRIEKKNAKAGNINNALLISNGELCVVLDPDHVPYPDFLDPIVSHFENEKIGFVQIVQAYKNYDESLVAKGAAQQTFQFYGPIMMTMNKYGTVLAIGANCTFRRKALESIGGHAAGLAEDMNTAMHLHAKGWKSVYVPQVLAKGLVPSTLSAYYAQQLKWSRGVFELLVTSYPKLFTKFTWQQKIHYATIPIYYLSGIIFLINFLIPILSLFLDTSPINIDFLDFMVYAGPLAIIAIIIRHFVQRWVMDEEERGFHIVGGLLMIGTWWIFLIGLFYTILRKKVPYNPTPKDGNEERNWKINLPNLTVIFISIFAVAYGLYNDWNPYNLIMSGFAIVNCMILLFSVVASRQADFRKLTNRNEILDDSINKISMFKGSFWLFRRYIYKLVRQNALLITFLITGSIVFWSIKGRYQTETTQPDHYRKNILIPGIFSPINNDGLTSLTAVKKIEAKSGLNFGIISFYLSWGDDQKSSFPKKLVDSIYSAKAIPMMTWEPWQSLFSKSKNIEPNLIEKEVFKRILNHEYDDYLAKFAIIIKNLKRPIFIRFAHEADNPQYPWSAVGGNSSTDFKECWKYIHQYFADKEVKNVIWVWNPWKTSAVDEYFPGKQFVDWIGVTNLNYGDKNKNWYSLEQLYQPFHDNQIFRSGLPVMLAETGSLTTATRQDEWLKTASATLENKFPEIKALVLFNSGIDHNLPVGSTENVLDWRIENLSLLNNFINKNKEHKTWLSSEYSFATNPIQKSNLPVKQVKEVIDQIRGVNYKKGQNWSTNGRVLKRKDIEQDMAEIKQMGFNTIKIYGFSIYDDNILKAAKEKGLQVAFSFWIPQNISFTKDSVAMKAYADKVLKKIGELTKNNNIFLWNLANSPLNELRYNNFKPDLNIEQEAYFLWLCKLVNSIKILDNKRPISIDMYVDEYFEDDYKLLLTAVPNLDCIGIVTNKNPNIKAKNLVSPAFMSKITSTSYLEDTHPAKGAFISDWQDEKTINYVSLNGVKDNTGTTKIGSYLLANKFTGAKKPLPMPMVKILLPATTIWPKTSANYHVVVYNASKWTLVNEKTSMKFRWELVKHDRFGNPVQITLLGQGKTINLTIPDNPSRYKIYLYTTRDSVVNVVSSKLNIPLN